MTTGELRSGGRNSPGTDTSGGLERMLPGLRTRLAGARRVAMRQMLVQRLRRIVARPDWLIATQLFGEMLSRAKGNPSATTLLESATLRAARVAESAGEWTAACRFWVWHASTSVDALKSSRNLARCARAITKSGHDQSAVRQALEAWQFLLALDPEAEDGQQGVAWCNASLARAAEEEANFTTARLHWAAVLEFFPSDEAALDGLRRAIESGATGAPAANTAQAERWQALHKHLTKTARSDYRSQCAAGRSLLTAGAPELAIPFLERALRQRRGLEAALLLVRCQLAAAQFDAAATTLETIRALGKLSEAPAPDVRVVLARAAPSLLRNELLIAIAVGFAAAPEVIAVLVPLLVARELRGQVLSLTDAMVDDSGAWSDSVVLDTAAYLAGIGEQDRALRFLSVFSAAPLINAAFLTCAERYQADTLERAMFAVSADPMRRLSDYVALAEHFNRRGAAARAAQMLCRIAASSEASLPFYSRNKDRLAALIANLIEVNGANREITEQLARLVVTWASDTAKTFFSSPEFAAVRAELEVVARFANAPVTSRLGLLREQYHQHHLERRENLNPAAIGNDFGCCEVALRYFKAMAELRPVKSIPISADLMDRLTAPCLPLSSGRFADLLMSCAMFRERPDIDLKSATLFERAVGWYVSRFMGANKVPSACLPPDAVDHFNSVVRDYSALGVTVTQFTQFLRTGPSKTRYKLENGLDALLFTLEVLALHLKLNPHYRPFLSTMLKPHDSAHGSLLDACVLALSDPIDSANAAGKPLSHLLSLRSVEDGNEVPTARSTAPQDVLIIGHGGHGTGLGRNFEMLSQALKGEDIALSTLGYESEPGRFARELKAWQDRCRSNPVVIAAVNAQDIPALFVRDRYSVLDRCQVVGFFLWETSQAPRVQRLGVGLVDEIWAPTKYVAEIYSPFAKVHVVGKGLFSKDAWPQAIRRPAGGTIKFLTVFDFHSSVERKIRSLRFWHFKRHFRPARMSSWL